MYCTLPHHYLNTPYTLYIYITSQAPPKRNMCFLHMIHSVPIHNSLHSGFACPYVRYLYAICILPKNAPLPIYSLWTRHQPRTAAQTLEPSYIYMVQREIERERRICMYIHVYIYIFMLYIYYVYIYIYLLCIYIMCIYIYIYKYVCMFIYIYVMKISYIDSTTWNRATWRWLQLLTIVSSEVALSLFQFIETW